jgi:sec-independent protein translocase protein TatC
MSGAIDEDTARAVESGRQTAGAFLSTVQTQLQKAFVAFLVGMLLGVAAMRRIIWPQLKQDLLADSAEVVTLTPFDVILLQVKIGLILGILLAIPVLLYYARDPLRERGILRDVPVSRARATAVATAAAVLFVGGSLYAYYVFFPVMFGFLAGNAVGAGFSPTYSIVAWTQFIFVLGLSFGLAAQLPLAMTALAYSGVVPYETFRDRWKYAMVAIVGFGAVFSPPDPFTQLMWSFPLAALYGLSLYLTKVVVTAKRGAAGVDVAEAFRSSRRAAAVTGVAAGAVVAALAWAVPAAVAPRLGVDVPTAGTVLGLSTPLALAAIALVGAVVAAAVASLLVVYRSLASASETNAAGTAALDLGDLDAAGVRAAPPELFESLAEEEAVAAAGEAMDAGNTEKAEAVLDRYDQVEAQSEETDGDDAEAETDDEASDPVTSTTAGVVGAFTEEETTEDDIGGYYYDIRFILDSLRSRVFRVALVFLLTMGGVFTFLYGGGFGRINRDFLSRLPADIGGVDPTTIQPVTLHPVEALFFMVKISVLLAAVVTVPVLLYYAWPALSDRGLVTGDRRVLSVWGVSVVGGLTVGSVVGYVFVAPGAISYLVADALRANMEIAYRVRSFFWLVFLTTAGVGILADIPVSMLLFYRGGLVSYRRLVTAWRAVVFGSFAFAAALTPDSIYTMLIIAVPVSLAYGLGVALLWGATLGGRRARAA